MHLAPRLPAAPEQALAGRPGLTGLYLAGPVRPGDDKFPVITSSKMHCRESQTRTPILSVPRAGPDPSLVDGKILEIFLRTLAGPVSIQAHRGTGGLGREQHGQLRPCESVPILHL